MTTTKPTLELINETTYNTDDLRELFTRILNTINSEEVREAVREDRRTWHCKADIPVKPLLVGYYSPKKLDSFARVTGVYSSRGARLGIVKPSKFYDSPLVSLAAQSDENPVVPKAGLQDIAEAMVCAMTSNVAIIDRRIGGPKLWGWLDDFALRYGAKVKRGARKRATLERKRRQLATYVERKIDIELSIKFYEEHVARFREELADVITEHDKLATELGLLEGK